VDFNEELELILATMSVEQLKFFQRNLEVGNIITYSYWYGECGCVYGHAARTEDMLCDTQIGNAAWKLRESLGADHSVDGYTVVERTLLQKVSPGDLNLTNPLLWDISTAVSKELATR